MKPPINPLMSLLLILAHTPHQASAITLSSLSLSLSPTPSPSSISTLFSLPTTPSWLENLVLRPNQRTLLATRLDIPQLWSIDTSTGEGTILANVSSSISLVGITPSSFSPNEDEEEEVYYIAGVNYTSTGVSPNSSVLYSLTYHQDSSRFSFEKAIALPEMTLINGLSPGLTSSTILATDSYQGAIYQIDVSSGTVSIFIQDAETMGTDFSSAGINGVKVFHGKRTYIYYTNTNKALIARVPVDIINPKTGLLDKTATPEILASNNPLLGAPDDFALLDDGSVLVATGAANTVVHVALNGTVTTVAGSEASLELASSTACQLGQGGRVLYVTTAGGEEGPVNGTVYGPGSVVAVKLEKERTRL